MEQNTINSTFRKILGSVQNEVGVTISADNNIAKILCSKAKSVINNFEALNGEIKFNGSVCFNVVYANEMGEIFSEEQSENFSGKLENENISVNTCAMFKTDVIELKEHFSSDEVKLNATVETLVEGLITNSLTTFESGDENVITNSNFVEYTTLMKCDKTSFAFEESFSTKDPIEKILMTNANVKVLDYSLGTDYFTLEGLIMFNCMYVAGDETKELKQFCKCYKFKEELESEGLTKDGCLILQSQINNCMITTNVEPKEDENVLNFSIPVDVNFAYLVKSNHEVVVDAYSLKNKLNLNIESFTLMGSDKYQCFDEKIDGQLVIDDDAPRIVKIVSFCGENVSVTNALKNGDNVVVEGLCSVNVIFMEDDDENEKLNSAIIEIPFSVENRFDDLSENDEILTTALIKDIECKCKKGKEINVDLDLMICVCAFNTSEEMALTGAEIGELLTPKEACLQIYFARKGNTLWDISKGLATKPEIILNQNPNLNLPLENDEKIVLFKGGSRKLD